MEAGGISPREGDSAEEEGRGTRREGEEELGVRGERLDGEPLAREDIAT